MKRVSLSEHRIYVNKAFSINIYMKKIEISIHLLSLSIHVQDDTDTVRKCLLYPGWHSKSIFIYIYMMFLLGRLGLDPASFLSNFQSLVSECKADFVSFVAFCRELQRQRVRKQDKAKSDQVNQDTRRSSEGNTSLRQPLLGT
jgi:hypothetical protein